MAEASPSSSKLPAPLRLVSPKKEPTKAYDALVIYYDLGEARDIKKVAEKLGCGWENIRKWRSRWWWDERIAAHEDDAKTIFRQALRERANEMADQVIGLRLKILEKQLKTAEAMLDRATLLNSLPVTEQEITKTSPDGMTQHITIKPIGVRATDGGRLALMSDAMIRSLTQQTSPPDPKGRGAFTEDGTPSGKLAAPSALIYIDNGDGTRGKVSDQPPPDEYIAGDEEDDDDADEGTNIPDGAAKL